MPLRTHLDAIFEHDRRLREEETRLLADANSAELVETLEVAVEEAKSSGDRADAIVRLERLADLCAQVPGPRMVDALIRILDDEEPQVRVVAGEALLDVGYERYAEVARAIERALDANARGPAMTELPFILAEIGEPSALQLIKRFLAHPDAEVVAAAIEALVHLDDPAASSALEKLVDDERQVTLEDVDQDRTTTIGELAEDAIDELEGA